jgi:hypothetical protein
VSVHGPAPSLEVHIGQERGCSGQAGGNGLADLQKDMGGVMDGLRKGLAVSAKVVIGAVSALYAHGKIKNSSSNSVRLVQEHAFPYINKIRSLSHALLQDCTPTSTHKRMWYEQ